MDIVLKDKMDEIEAVQKVSAPFFAAYIYVITHKKEFRLKQHTPKVSECWRFRLWFNFLCENIIYRQYF